MNKRTIANAIACLISLGVYFYLLHLNTMSRTKVMFIGFAMVMISTGVIKNIFRDK